MQTKMRQRTEDEEWIHLLNDPNQFEKERYIDSINACSSIIEELQKLYEETPAVDRTTRARILSGLKKSKRDLP